MNKVDLAALRENYTKGSLDVSDVLPSPIQEFHKWFNQAVDSQILEPNAMHLCTVSPDGKPSARIVLLKTLDATGFTFYTNYQSRKGHEMDANPNACLTFFWGELERQVRIEGTIEKVDAKDSDDYFAVRPRGSQIGAWVSNQSQVVESREVLIEKEKAFIAQFEGQDVPRPDHWGGYRLVPNYIEFWQGRPSRLHDRIAYTLEESGNWKIERLSP